MFTGIVRELGVVEQAGGSRLRVRSRLRGLKRGDSVCVNGACLTLVRRARGRLEFDVGPTTRELTTLGALAAGSAVGLEPALKAGDALGGHLVAGHVDATARVLALDRSAGFARLRVELPAALAPLVAERGSVAVDGVSLTVSRVGRGRPPGGRGRPPRGRGWFEAMLIPETLRRTTLGARRPGESVNLEADLVARYLARLAEAR